MKISDSLISSCSGLGDIRVRSWEPENEPVGILQIAHGVAEHVERYDDFAVFLVEKGWKVVAGDHLGHGKSAPDTKGWFGEKNGWFNVVGDLKQIYDGNYVDGIPYFILGHSMGSFLLRTYLTVYPDARLSGAIISGTAWQPGGILKAGIAMCNIQKAIKGSDKVSEMINNMAFGAYNNKIENPKSKNDWLSRREDIVAQYDEDPLCGFSMTVGLAKDMFSGIAFNQKAENLLKMNKDIPVFFIAGDMDPVGDYGKGVVTAKDAFVSAGMNSVDIKLYPDGRHEMLNETNYRDVYNDLYIWLESKK
ncbi:MAG: alpha/beta hydrolase [Ruminococcaceae bacterium]|nr:alpha/beta hydrolase [Oscillospiraceae bacterium]